MAIKYGFKPSGAFVVVDTTRPLWTCAYPTSPYCDAAMKNPEATARAMAETMDRDAALLAAQSARFRKENDDIYAAQMRFATTELAAVDPTAILADVMREKGAVERDGAYHKPQS